MDIVYFAVINFVDLIQKAKKEYDGTYSFIFSPVVHSPIPPLFSPRIIRGIAEIEMKQWTACEHTYLKEKLTCFLLTEMKKQGFFFLLCLLSVFFQNKKKRN